MKKLKRFLSASLAAVMTTASISGLLVTPVWASTTTYGDFKVTTSDGTCSYEDNVLTISGSGTYTVEMADGITSTSNDRIFVGVSGYPTIILNNVDITSNEGSPLEFSYQGSVSAKVNLEISGTNSLKSTASGYAGLQTDGVCILAITSTEGDGSTDGNLTATGGSYSAGIGGGYSGNCSSITINGGTIVATGGIYGTGIGGGQYGDGSNITINGGSITAYGGAMASGIGGGHSGDCNNITITGGTVAATGGNYGAGIGGGTQGNCSSVTITGGTITANGGKEGAGIGGGNYSNGAGGDCSYIYITDGTITATGGQYGAGIGGGQYGDGCNITIKGGTINAAGGSYASSIGGGYSFNNGRIGGNGKNISISDGYITLSKETDSAAYIGAGSGGSSEDINISGGYFSIGSTATNKVYSVNVSPYVVVNNTNSSTKTTYPYTVTYLTGIKVAKAPSTTTYIAGQNFSDTGMVVNAIYANGYTVQITDYTYSPETLSIGDTYVYIMYNGSLTTTPVSVSEKEVSSIAITTQPTKTDYIVGQSFDPGGMVVTVTYTDGSTAKVDNDLLTYTYSGGSGYFTDYLDGEYITVSYAGKTADTDTFTVEEKTAVSIAVTGIPANLSFYSNETYTAIYSALMSTVYNNGSYDGQYYISNTLISRLENDGLELTVTYNDGSTAVIANTAAYIRLNCYSTSTSLSGISSSIITTSVTDYVMHDSSYASAIKITYGSVSTSIPITVWENEITGISVTKQPTKTNYSEGDSFDPSGMTVTAVYADGSEEEITDYSYSSINGTGSVSVYITYGSFYDTVTVNVEEAQVVTMTGIIASSAPTKTTYVAGENFDKSGMVIEAVYSDGSTSEITDYNYSPTTLSESDTSVIITYGNFYTTILINVSAKEITSISVTTAPTKTEYVQGEVFDSSGMIVTATYSDGTTADLASSEYSYSTEALTTLGNINFEISAANCTATTPITVIEKEISSISVTQYPDKVSYYDGQSFDSTGMIVQALYNDGSTAIISDYSVSPTVLSSGDTEVTVSKDGFSDVVKITVSEKSLSKIAVTSQPSVISYIAGETFNSTGMTVTAYYNDNSSETITDYTITNPIMTAGTDTVYITYGGLYTTVSVTVTEKTVIGIEVSKQPSKTSYIAGEAFDTSGMIINLNYSDGSYEEIINYNYSPVTLSTGDTSVLITYGNYFATVPVSVVTKEITGIEIATYPDKITYVEGEVFDDSGMVVLASYNDGSTSYLASNEYNYSTDPLTLLDLYVTVYAGNVSDIVPIRVVDKEITGIAVTEYPNKISYYAGQSFDSSGMVVEATYNDNSTAIISDYDVNPTTITSGTTEVIISKDGYSDTVKISVSDIALKSIAVTTPPAKTSYYAGETFVSDGMVVTGYYNDGSSSEITDYSISNSTLSSGTTLVYITYDGLYATTSVTVSDKTITGIEIAEQPTKTSYVAGQTFVSDGMVVNAIYSDGSTAEVTGYSISPSTLSVNDTNILVTYGNYFASVAVSVAAKEIESISIIENPSKVDYVEGEVFDPSGMIVEAAYNDGSTSYLTSSEYTYSTSALTTSDNSVTIYAGDVSASVSITVVEKEITGISVTEYPDKTAYISGQSFDSTGMTVEATYNDGTTAVITDYSVSPTTITSGTTEVTISKDGYSDTVKISVSDVVLNSIAVTKAPTKTVYVAGESFDNSGMIVMGYYNDGSSAEITDYSVSNSTLSAGTTLIYVTYDGLYATTAVTVTDKTLTGITVTSQPSKISYVAGENFSTDGLVITAEYNDGTTEEITNYSYSPVSLSTSDTSVMVTYGNYFITIPISVVAKEITSIEVINFPDKTIYIEGETFDDDGMIIEATFNDGSTSYLASNEYSFTSDPLTTADFYVTVTAGSASAFVPVRVIDKTITGITVTEYPDKVSYISGQTFDKSGMTVVAKYNDGSTAIIYDYTVSPETITSDTTEIVVSKDGYSDTVKISVSDVTLTSIAVTVPPTKVNYYAGQTFDSSGMTVIGYYNDGSSEEITDYTISNPTLTSGTSLVYITYDNLYTTVAVSVSEKTLTGISIEQQPDTVSYIAGQSFNNEGMIILANYSDGTSEEISDYSVSPSVLSINDAAVLITYESYFASIGVSVAAKEVESISVTSEPSKTSYIEGETFDPSGLIIEVLYNDGSVEYLPAGSNEISYSTDPLTTADEKITVTVGGKTAEVPISVVKKEIVGIAVTESPSKISYVVGETVDLSGIEVEATFNDGSSAIIEDYEYSPSIISADTAEIIVSKDGYSDAVSIVVSEKAVVSLDVTTQPNKTSYFAGQTFDPAGMVISITYNDGTTEEISDYSIINSVLSLDTDCVYITYGSLFTTVPVTVSEKVLTDIAVTIQPNTVSYVVGQSFNTDGMVVTGYFTDGSTEEISDYEIDTDALILGQTKVYVTYGGYYDIVNVSVVAKKVTAVEIISEPTKTDYVEGETFNSEGLVIRVVYNDGEEEIMTYDNDSISYPTEPLTTDDISVKITVGGVSAKAEISVVSKEITGIQVTTSPTKIDYIVGQNFNPDGMIVTAYYNDNTSAEISDYSYTPETVSANTDEITIIKDGFTDTIKIAVSERVITNIEVTTLPNKTEYTENDAFDPAGMTVTAYFNDNTAEEITDYNVDDFLLSVDTDKVYITYENLFTTVDIIVNGKTITAIEIITPPITTEYVEGQSFNTVGMVVKAYYDDNSEAILETYDYEPNGALALEDSIITVSKDGAAAEQAITVIERVVTGIEIAKNPDKTDYTEGELFNPDGMEVIAEYNDGSTEIITDYTYPTEPFAEGDTSATISYDNFTAEVPITLSVDDILSYISERNGDVNRDGSVSREDALILMRYLANAADFDEYAIHTGNVDDDGQLTDKDVTLINNHISGNSTLSEAAAVEADIDGDGEVSENDLNLVRKAVLNMWSLDVIYEANADANDDGEINMLDVVWILTHFKKATTIDYIYIAEQPDKTSYVEGQSFDPAGMTVKAVYLDGTEEEITDYTYPLDALEIGDTSIEIEYEGFTAEVEITVIEKRIGFDTTESSTEATTENSSDESSETTTNSGSETTTKNNSGDDETTTRENGSDGSTETTTESNSDGSTETTTDGGNSDSTTEATTEYNYGNSEGVVIVNLPNKVNYVEGEIFDPEGILILLYWNDGSTSYITENDVTVDETPLTLADIYGVIYYEYKNDTEKINVPIVVVEKKAVSAEIVTMPDKTEYNDGETFDPDGMEVEVTYNDGSKEIIPGEDVVFDDTPLTPDDDSVVVSADGIEVEVPIIVNETTTESTTEATTEDTETTTKKSSGGGGGGSGSSSSHTTTETTTEATTESDDSDVNGDTDGTNDSDNGESTDGENSDNNGNGSNGFTDVVGHWAEKYIEHLHNLGIVNGIDDTLYSPDTSTKRGDFAVVLNRLLNLEDGNATFDDVDSNSYYAQAISNCAAADIFIGYGDGTFKPEQVISRQEMFVIMAKLFASADYDFSDADLTILDDFTDGSAVSEWAKPYTSYLVSVGAVVGDDNELRPTDYITRAEMAVIIYNYLN